MNESKQAGTPAIDTPLGELKILGVVHNAALNCLVTRYAEPAEWEMKQFTSEAELEGYARENKLILIPLPAPKQE